MSVLVAPLMDKGCVQQNINSGGRDWEKAEEIQASCSGVGHFHTRTWGLGALRLV